RRLESLARSMMDGLAVWVRELSRRENERSPGVIRHETERARRLLDVWEAEVAHPLMGGALNLPQLTLACAVGFLVRLPGYEWRPNHPKLAAWFAPFETRPSFVA